MNKDTICREDAIDEMERIMADHPLQGYEDELLLINAIKSLPSADGPQGHWEIYIVSPFDGEDCRCSECGATGCVPYWDYCPYCGARMKGVSNGEDIPSADE